LRNLDADGATAYLMTSPFERTRPVQSAVPPYVIESGLPIVAILYDLIPEVVDVYPRSLMPAYWARRELLQQADLLLTLSEHVRGDAVARLGAAPERVAVIGAAASDAFRPPLPGERPLDLVSRRLPEVTKSFVLCVTAWSPHKNVEALIDAWSRIPRAIRDTRQLILACKLPPEAGSAWSDRARARGLDSGDVVVTDYVDDEVLLALYQGAELFVLPSRQEGFGLTVLEAARCACPAITSSATSLPEVLDWEPATFPPDDSSAMAALIERALTDEDFRAQLRAVGDAAVMRHTWTEVADRAIGACASMPDPRRPRRVPRLRIAVVGCFTSSAGPCAATEVVARRLADHCHVDRFALAGSANDRRHGSGRYPTRALGRVFDPWGYDAIVYAVDRHPPRELLELANRYPGIVWFVETPDERSAAVELGSGARGRVVSAGVAAPAVGGAPFVDSVPTRVAAVGDGEPEVTAILEFAREALRARAGDHPTHRDLSPVRSQVATSDG
jgi:glycosyltransferase involved in cell wall biosynthesis